MKQYYSVKAVHPDAILLFRVGDFYETYGQDAARAATTPAVCEALDRTESMFDTVFIRCVEQEYYMRLMVDVYNDVMPPALDSLCRAIATEK